MKMDDKNGRLRIAVLGDADVGKSALTVRYLTRRYIGEYRSNTDLLYTKTVATEHNGQLEVEIVDVSVEPRSQFPVEHILWADASLVVYSVTDRESFRYAQQAVARIGLLKPSVLVFLLGNKLDLDHMRDVSKAEGDALSHAYGIEFCEVSVADNSSEVYTAFDRLINQGRERKDSSTKQPRKFSVSKMIGTLIGANDHSNRKLSCSAIASKQKLTMVEFGKRQQLQTRDIHSHGYALTTTM